MMLKYGVALKQVNQMGLFYFLIIFFMLLIDITLFSLFYTHCFYPHDFRPDSIIMGTVIPIPNNMNVHNRCVTLATIGLLL